jgi:hypothetical protein
VILPPISHGEIKCVYLKQQHRDEEAAETDWSTTTCLPTQLCLSTLHFHHTITTTAGQNKVPGGQTRARLQSTVCAHPQFMSLAHCQSCERRRNRFICSLTAWTEMTRTNTRLTLWLHQRIRSHYPSIHVSRHPGKTRFPLSFIPSRREQRRQPAVVFRRRLSAFFVTSALPDIGLQHPSTASHVCTTATQPTWTTENCPVLVLNPSSC